MSSSSSSGSKLSIVASVAGPALTINNILRGFSKDCTNSSIEYVGWICLPADSLTICSVFSGERLKTDTL